MILNWPLLCAVCFAFALLVEKDEWAGRQTLQALGLSLIVYGARHLASWGLELLPDLSGLHDLAGTALGIFVNLVYLAAIVCSVVAILRVGKTRRRTCPGSRSWPTGPGASGSPGPSPPTPTSRPNRGSRPTTAGPSKRPRPPTGSSPDRRRRPLAGPRTPGSPERRTLT